MITSGTASSAAAAVEEVNRIKQSADGLINALATEGAGGLSAFFEGLSGAQEEVIVPEVDPEPALTALGEVDQFLTDMTALEYEVVTAADTLQAGVDLDIIKGKVEDIAGTYDIIFNAQVTGQFPGGVPSAGNTGAPNAPSGPANTPAPNATQVAEDIGSI